MDHDSMNLFQQESSRMDHQSYQQQAGIEDVVLVQLAFEAGSAIGSKKSKSMFIDG